MHDYGKERDRREDELREKERYERENREKDREKLSRDILPIMHPADRELEKQRLYHMKEDFDRLKYKASEGEAEW